MTTIAVTGATGHLGRLAIAALKLRAPGATIIALARDPAKVADLGVQARSADYSRPETLPAALAGVDVLVLISSSSFDDRAGQHRNVIAAAKQAGVKRIVYTSILKGDASPMKLALDHIETETALRASGVPATVLRNGWYTENYTMNLGGALAAGAVIGSSGQGRISAAPRADYAEAIAVVAADDSHAGKTYELAGDTSFTLADYAAEVSKLAGKTIPYNDLPEATYADILKSFGLPEGFAMVLADSDIKASKGSLQDDSHTLSKLIGRPTVPVQQTLAEAFKAM
ncbi:MAG: NAD(P)-dependent oxidoreductase [Cereibacter sphaeroides]|uniref:NAD(P)-dependent oxidoreductase n=1 Tax=Cereibacter sphaeroides TaxID=1063 RepID=A0A2W5SDT5_CERSP|nr:MAG: NAD(P)-dependent oxidoreductase [Cereibacter sphaeroides]